MLIEKIKADQIAARKNHDAVAAPLLTTLLGEAQAIGKNDGNRETTDAEVVAVVKKFIKGMDETLGYLKDAPEVQKATTLIEKSIMEGYLPKQMTTQEIEDALKLAILEQGNNMGKVMGVMKTKYDGQYDGKLVFSIAKSLLS